MKTINFLGSTGTIGKKSLKIIQDNFSNYKINYLLCLNNYKLLAEQARIFKPKYIGIINDKYYNRLKNIVNSNTKIISGNECYKILDNKVNLSIICISGNAALKCIHPTIINSKTIGIVNKESIVSAGKFITNIAKKNNTNIVPLDSEHNSIYNFLNNYNKNFVNEILLTASGGPFLFTNLKKFKNISLKDSLKHPTWKMGIKNTIDSATMINKCLEVIEAHYLFNIDYSKLKIIIHPESLIHSIIKTNDGNLIASISKNDMSIPIFNFLNNKNNLYNRYNNLDLTLIKKLNFFKPNKNRYKSLKIFDQIDKNSISEIIVFNISNEIAVNLFIKHKIKFIDITKFIEKSLNKFEKINICNINQVLQYQDFVYNKLMDTSY